VATNNISKTVHLTDKVTIGR